MLLLDPPNVRGLTLLNTVIVAFSFSVKHQ